jgi:hypothetical protein
LKIADFLPHRERALRGRIRRLSASTYPAAFSEFTGVVYELDDNLKPIQHYYLGDQDALQKAMDAVKNQGKAK